MYKILLTKRALKDIGKIDPDSKIRIGRKTKNNSSGVNWKLVTNENASIWESGTRNDPPITRSTV